MPETRVTPSRRIAFEVLQHVFTRKHFPDDLLRRYLERFHAKPEDRHLATELVYGVLRWQNRLDDIVSRFSERPAGDIHFQTRIILRIGAYQILFLGGVPDFAAVDEAVRLERQYGERKRASFVNGLLRSLCRERNTLTFPDFSGDPVGYLTVTQSHPVWLVKRWITRFGLEETRKLVESHNRIPPRTLRMNTLKTHAGAFEKACAGEGGAVEKSRFLASSYCLLEGTLHDSGLFGRGMFLFQDEGSQLAGAILSPLPGERVLDACAAPGGKTSHLAALSDNRACITAVDAHAKRFDALQKNCRRLGVEPIHCVLADMQSPPFQPESFDRILLDAPCSGTGTVRRNPDIKWHRTEEDILRNGRKIKTLLYKTAVLLKNGGRLIFATCSLEAEEGEEVIQEFLADHGSYRLEVPGPLLPDSLQDTVTPEGFVRTFPHRHNMDGFFIAILTKK